MRSSCTRQSGFTTSRVGRLKGNGNHGLEFQLGKSGEYQSKLESDVIPSSDVFSPFPDGGGVGDSDFRVQRERTITTVSLAQGNVTGLRAPHDIRSGPKLEYGVITMLCLYRLDITPHLFGEWCPSLGRSWRYPTTTVSFPT